MTLIMLETFLMFQFQIFFGHRHVFPGRRKNILACRSLEAKNREQEPNTKTIITHTSMFPLDKNDTAHPSNPISRQANIQHFSDTLSQNSRINKYNPFKINNIQKCRHFVVLQHSRLSAFCECRDKVSRQRQPIFAATSSRHSNRAFFKTNIH